MPFRTQKTKVYQYDFVIRGRRFRGSLETEDLDEAKVREAKLKAEAGDGVRQVTETSPDYTLGQAIGTYYSAVCESQTSAGTSMSQARGLIDFFGKDKRLSELTRADMQAFISSRRKVVSAGTINRQIDFLGRSIRHMVEHHRGLDPDLQLRKLRLKEPKERVRALTAAEQERLFQHLRPDLHAFVKFALLTGARLSSIALLRWSQVDLQGRVLVMQVKGGHEQHYPISDELASLLEGLPRSDHPDHRPFVFLYQRQNRRGKPWARVHPKAGSLWEDFRAALRAADIHDFRFHDVRHSFATRMLRQSGNLKLVSKLLGHSSVETTMRYAHVLDDDLRDALDDFTLVPKARPQNRPQT